MDVVLIPSLTEQVSLSLDLNKMAALKFDLMMSEISKQFALNEAKHHHWSQGCAHSEDREGSVQPPLA